MALDKEIGNRAARAGLWYTCGNILVKGCVFLSLPIFTRLLTTADFGIYNTYIAYEQILTAILGLGFYATIKNAKLDYGQKFEEYLSAVLSLSLIVLSFVLVAVNLSYHIIAEMLGFSRFITNCLILQAYGAYLLHFYGTRLNVDFEFKPYLIMTFFNGIGNVVCSILLILFVFPSERYLGRIFGSAIPLIVIAIVVTVILLGRGRRFYELGYWRYALAIGLPLIPHVLSQSLLSQFDRIMISDAVGPSEAGIYSYIYTLCTILTIISSSLESAWAPWVYLMLNEKRENDIRKASKSYIAFFTLLTIGFMCIMPEMIKLIAENEYWQGVGLLFPLSIGNYFVFLYSFPVMIEYYHKKTSYISIGTVAAAALNVVLNYILINIFGYCAAAYTTMVAYMFLFMFHWIMARRFGGNIIYGSRDYLFGLGAVLFMGVLLAAIQLFVILSIVVRYVLIVIIILVLTRHKEMLLSIIRKRG